MNELLTTFDLDELTKSQAVHDKLDRVAREVFKVWSDCQDKGDGKFREFITARVNGSGSEIIITYIDITDYDCREEMTVTLPSDALMSNDWAQRQEHEAEERQAKARQERENDLQRRDALRQE